MIALGAPEKVIQAFHSRTTTLKSDECQVWRCNWKAVTTFLECQTQWRRHPVTGAIDSLDYAAVIAFINLNFSRRKGMKVLSKIQKLERFILAEVHREQ